MSGAVAERSDRTSTLPLMLRRALPTPLIVAVFALFLAGYVVRVSPETNGDGRLALTYAMIDEGRLAIDTYVAAEPALLVDAAIRDGHYYAAKPPLPSLLLAPVYAIVRLGTPPASVGDPVWRWLMSLALSGTSFAAIVLLLWRLQARLGLRSARSPIPALAAATGTPLLVYASFGLSHVLAAAMLLGVLYCAVRAPRHGLLSGVLAGALVATETVAAIGAAVPFAWVLWVRLRAFRPRGLIMPLAAAAAGPLALAWYLAAAFGSPFADMYAYLVTPEFRAGYVAGAMALPRPEVLVALLLTPNRGLLVFAPIVLVGIWRMAWLWRHDPSSRAAVALSAAGTITMLLALSGYVFWYGGSSYGPRYLVPALPLLCWSLASMPLRSVALVGLAASLPQLFALSVHEPLLDLVHVFPYADYAWRENSPTVLGPASGPGAFAAIVPSALVSTMYLIAARRSSLAPA